MFGFATLVALAAALSAALPDAIRTTLEAQLPAWSQVMGEVTPASEAQERIAVERSTSSEIHVVLIERKLKLELRREDDRTWITEAVWCGAVPNRCEDVWTRTDEQWRSDHSTANHTGYAVYRDSLRLAPTVWTESVPSLATGKKVWDKGACQGGLCFLVAARDSSVARAAVRPDGSVFWWDGGYILGGTNEKEMIHAYRYLLESGRAIPSKKGK